MILITGATGFVGSHLTPLIKKEYKDEEIFCLNEPKFDLVTGKNLDKIPDNPRLIIHLAAATDTSKKDQRCNDVGTKNLIEYLPKIRPKTHFIFTSSQAIFSDRHDTGKPINEKTKPATNNKYGKTKLEAENILLAAAKKKEFKLTIIRLPTVWGENPRKNSFLNFLRSLVNKNSIISRLNWSGKVSLINVDDAAKFILKSSASTPQKPKIIAISTENLTLAEIFEKITTGKGKNYNQIKLPDFVWNLASLLRPYMKYFEPILPANIYNYFWRASIVADSPLWCKGNVRGIKFS
ncbi:MAG: SDR family oxidoreductase [Candidatus Woesebacteria bacterium]|nr:SDR family oxidoreductase [Candidatus Woesebacteria bacterium]